MPIRHQSVEDVIESLEELLRETKPGSSVPVEHLKSACETLTVLNRRFLRTVRVSDNYQIQVRSLVDELKEALAKIRSMKGIVHICSSCKQISVDQADWQPLDVYIAKRTDTRFSHGMCPDCSRRLYGDFVPQVTEPAKPEDSAPASGGRTDELDLTDPVVARFLPMVNDPLLADKALHDDVAELFHKYVRLQRRMKRIAEISDRYQAEFRRAKADQDWAAHGDPLTGLSNRIAFQETLETERLSGLASGKLPALVSVKVSNLRDLNHSHGLAAGDQALRAAAVTLRAAVPDLRLCGRWKSATLVGLFPADDADPASARVAKLSQTAKAAGEAMTPQAVLDVGWAALRAGDALEAWLSRAGAD